MNYLDSYIRSGIHGTHCGECNKPFGLKSHVFRAGIPSEWRDINIIRTGPICRSCAVSKWGRFEHIGQCQICGRPVHMKADSPVINMRRKQIYCCEDHRQKIYRPGKTAKSAICTQCGGTYIPKRSDQRFCSTKCRVYWNRNQAKLDITKGSSMKQLFTIGYEGADLEDFLKVLQEAETDVLLDVRELPMSRRKGFSKTALKAALAEVGIDYRHEKQLGSPKDVRHQLREDWDYKRFFRDFNKHLRKQASLLETLSQELSGNVALMCYEKDHTTCHRTTVVDKLANNLDLKPIHLSI